MQFYQEISLFNRKITRQKKRPIVFITPEIGKWTSIGGLGRMVDILTVSLEKKLHENNNKTEIYVITLAYKLMPKTEKNELESEGFQSERFYLDFNNEWCDVYFKRCSQITYVFLNLNRNDILYLKPYIFDKTRKDISINPLVLFPNAIVRYLRSKEIVPSVIISNDNTTIMIAPLIKQDFLFRKVKLIHICHLLESFYFYGYASNYLFDYEQHYTDLLNTDILSIVMYFNSSYSNFSGKAIQQLMPYSFYLENFGDFVAPRRPKHNLLSFLTPFFDFFITVSPTYLSQIKPLVFSSDYPCAGIINGIPIKEYIERFPKKSDAKNQLQNKYFNSENPNMIIFSFIGRYAPQKGIDLLIDAIENLLKDQNIREKVQFLIGGYVYTYYPIPNSYTEVGLSMKETINKMKSLTQSYPQNFWANIENKFFEEGPLFNRGSDFGLVPSRYEPCGLVQQEYFVAGTPVIASEEGGLNDTVFDDGNKINGIRIKKVNAKEIEEAIRKAVGVYQTEQGIV